MNMTTYKNHRLPSIFRDFFDAPVYQGQSSSCRRPAVDVFEKDGDLQLEAELPGFSKEEISVEFKDGLLSFTAQKGELEEKNVERYFHRERSNGKLSRSYRLGNDYNGKKIEARFEDGVLYLSVPKSAEKKPVAVKIN
jgi:HSP20 family protein